MAMQNNYGGGLTCSIDVTDIEVAMNWYENVLGFKKLYYLKDLGWCEMESPVAHVNVGLSQVDEMLTPSGNAILVWSVKDITQAKVELEKNNVQLDGEIHTIPAMVKLLNFSDPFGNTLMLYQDISK